MSDSEGDADDVLDKFLAKVDEVGEYIPTALSHLTFRARSLTSQT